MTSRPIHGPPAHRTAADRRAAPRARLQRPAPNLVGLSRDELKTTLVEAGLELFRARQVWQWVYWHGVTDFGRMTNIAKDALRLAELFVVERPEIVTEQRSTDGTRKWLLRFRTATRPRRSTSREDRGSVSSQVGCTLTCSFCHTGTRPGAQPGAGRDRRPVHGSARQLQRVADADRDHARAEQHRHDGHGRAAYNFDNVATALRIVMDEQGIALSRRRITPRPGVVPMIPGRRELDVNPPSRCMR
jgi:23S rRNA (adenine2503-C2)-methyltransferase